MMTKQEEIREGIARRLPIVGTGKPDWVLAGILLNYLHSKGVVIKVGEISDDLAQTASESPKYFAQGNGIALVSSEKTFHIFEAFKGMNFAAVERLVEE